MLGKVFKLLVVFLLRDDCVLFDTYHIFYNFMAYRHISLIISIYKNFLLKHFDVSSRRYFLMFEAKDLAEASIFFNLMMRA